MAINKITFVAELKDRMTGPTKSAQRAIERLGDSAERAGQAAAAGLGKAERAAESHGRKSTSAHDKAGKAAEGSATRTGKAAGRMERAFQKIDGATGRMATALNRHSGTGATATERSANRISRALGGIDASGAASKFGRGMDTMASHASTAASKIESAMSKAGKAIGLATGALATASIAGGMNRIVTTEQSQVLLETIGIVGKEQEKVQALFKETALDTPYGTPDVALLGSGLLSSGMEAGKLEGALQGSVDAAALSGVALSDIALPLRQIQAGGKLQGDETEQLEERMIPIRRWLAEYKDVDISEVKGMISEGNVSSDDVFGALQQGAEGGAERAGATIKGAWMNMVSSFSLAGESFLQPLVEPLKGFMVQVKETMKGAQPFFAELGNKVAPGIAAAAEHAPKLMAALEPLGGPLLAAAGSFAELLPAIVQGLTLWAGVLALILPPVLNFASYLADLTGPFLPVLIPLLFAAGTAFTTWRVLKFISPLLGVVGKGIGLLGKLLLNHPLLRLATLLYAGIKGLEWLYENVGWVRKAFDWLGDSVRGVLGFFDDLSNKISDLIEDKFPRLHSAATTAMQFGDGAGAGGSNLSWADRALGYGAVLGEKLDLPDVGGNREARANMLLDDAPRHAEGGWTASGAHVAVVGEEGREFVVNHWASEKLASIPGAIPAISQGKLPVQGVPVPFGVNSAQPVAAGGDTYEINIYDARDANAVVAQIEAWAARQGRTKRLTNSTLTARGAR